MRNRVFTVILVLASLFLTLLWLSEQSYRRELRQLDSQVREMVNRVHMLRLKALALEAEMQLVNISTYIRSIKGWNVNRKEKEAAADSAGGRNVPGVL